MLLKTSDIPPWGFSTKYAHTLNHDHSRTCAQVGNHFLFDPLYGKSNKISGFRSQEGGEYILSKPPHWFFVHHNMEVELCGGDKIVQKVCQVAVMNASFPFLVLNHIP